MENKAKRPLGDCPDMNLRARYTWHLRPPFKDQFDCSHWWQGKPDNDIQPVAALYELTRRDPRIGHLRSKLRNAKWNGQELRARLVDAPKQRIASQAFDDLGQQPKAIHCLCLIGLKSWPTLDWRDQEYWEMSAGKMKGVDSRHASEQCYSISSEALCDIIHKRRHALKLGRKAGQFWVKTGTKNTDEDSVAPVHPRAFEKSTEIVAKHLLENPISAAEIEAAIAEVALAAHHQGHWLLAVAPNLTHAAAAHLLARRYREEQKRYPRPKHRARWEDWLPLISAFEDAETQHGGAKSQVFIRYRRALDGIRFTRDRPLL
jgi:hypothetical protein